MRIHFNQVQDLVGFAASNTMGGEKAKVLTRASIISDEPEFYIYVDQISNIFLSKADININAVHQFLVLIHQDLSADLYINDFPVVIEIHAKRDIKKGEIVRQGDIADIRRLEFPDIKIIETDKVIYCLKVGWKFGLFFDLDRSNNLNLEMLSLTFGSLYRYLSFQYIYKVLESGTQFEEMIDDGWFPFIELIGGEYKTLSEIYQNKFDFENRIEKFISGFDKARIEKIIAKWWDKQVFKEKQQILQAGVNAFLKWTNDGYIQCIKTLYSEIEGIIRLRYATEISKKNITFPKLLEYILEKGRTKFGSDFSLPLPLPFFRYLKNIVFARFNLAKGKLDLSRHTVGHGVARTESYTKTRALQAILVLDQIYFYL